MWFIPSTGCTISTSSKWKCLPVQEESLLLVPLHPAKSAKREPSPVPSVLPENVELRGIEVYHQYKITRNGYWTNKISTSKVAESKDGLCCYILTVASNISLLTPPRSRSFRTE